MKAILTKYRGPTNTKGTFVIAKAEGVPSMRFPWNHALDADQNHAQAARALARKYDWCGDLVSGGLPDGSEAHVFVNHKACKR